MLKKNYCNSCKIYRVRGNKNAKNFRPYTTHTLGGAFSAGVPANFNLSSAIVAASIFWNRGLGCKIWNKIIKILWLKCKYYFTIIQGHVWLKYNLIYDVNQHDQASIAPMTIRKKDCPQKLWWWKLKANN